MESTRVTLAVLRICSTTLGRAQEPCSAGNLTKPWADKAEAPDSWAIWPVKRHSFKCFEWFLQHLDIKSTWNWFLYWQIKKFQFYFIHIYNNFSHTVYYKYNFSFWWRCGAGIFYSQNPTSITITNNDA